MRPRRVIGGLIGAALASVLVYAVLAAFTDAAAVNAQLRAFPAATFAVMLLLAAIGFVARGLRWGWLMGRLEHPTRATDALYMQLSGQTMTVTPGRVGEVFKSWLAKDIAGLPMTSGIALVFAERVADLIAVCILSLGGLSLLGGNTWTLGGALAAIALGVVVASSRWFHKLSLKAISKQEWAQQHHASAVQISQTIQVALRWDTLARSVPVSVLAWGLEGVGFALCLNELGFDEMSVAGAVSVYAVSTLVGAVTFLPGGIGLTEASMAGVLIALGMTGSDASAATLITRVATLWWGVAVGWAALATRPSQLRALVAGRADGIEDA